MNKLFAVYLGGKAKGANIEVHDIAFVVAENIKAAFPQLKEKWFGDKKTVHVDSWAELSEVAGHTITLSNKPNKGLKLYFVNVGFYEKETFGEQHRFYFLVAASKEEARGRAKQLYAKTTQLPHIDNLIEVDDLLEVNEVDGFHLDLKKKGATKPLDFENVYWPIK